jgi:hypothetical protein
VVDPDSPPIPRVGGYSRIRTTTASPPSPTGLSPPPVARSSGVRLKAKAVASGRYPAPCKPFYPAQAARTSSFACPVWAPPVSLAATPGILSFPQGTEMFQFPQCPHPHSGGCITVAGDGLPHSDTPGSPVASSSPGLFAAWPCPSSAAGAKASTVRSSSWIIHHIPLHTPQHSTPIHSRFPILLQIGPPAHACCCFVPQTTPFKKRMTVSGFLTQQKTCLIHTDPFIAIPG